MQQSVVITWPVAEHDLSMHGRKGHPIGVKLAVIVTH